MSHGFMGIRGAGLAYIVGSTAFLAYLSRAFTGPTEPKFSVEPIIADLAKETQPGILPEHYYIRNKIEGW